MNKELANKMNSIASGLMSDVVEDGEECKELGQFLGKVANMSFLDDESANCLIEAVDRLNDSVVKVLKYVYDKNLDAEWYRCVVFLFDENVNFNDCSDIIIRGISVGLTCEDFDDLLINSSDQDGFILAIDDAIRNKKRAAEMEYSEDSSFEGSLNVGMEFINHLKSEIEQLQKQNNSLERQVEEYQEKEKDLIEEYYTYKSETKDKDSEIEGLKSSLAKANRSLMLSNNKYKQSVEMFNLEKEINGRLSEQLKGGISSSASETLSEELAALKSDFSKVDNDNVRLTSENERLSDEMETIKKEKEAYYSQVVSLQEDVRRLEEKNASLKDEVNGLRNRTIPDTSIPPDIAPTFSEADFDMASILSERESEEKEVPEPIFSSDFTASIFNDEGKEDYSQDDVLPIKSKKSSVLKNCNIFSKLLSDHFEKKFKKKPQAEQNNLIFVKLMEGSYSKDVVSLVKKTIEGNASVPRLEIYRLLSSRSNENDIIRLCNAA